MSDDIHDEMNDLRNHPEKSRSKKDKVDSGGFASEKAQAAREARQAKMASKSPPPVSSPPPPASEPSSPAMPTFMAQHTVVSGDTLSHIAAKYYNSSARDKWMAIYEANKETIGDNPSLIRVGQVLQIPQLDS